MVILSDSSEKPVSLSGKVAKNLWLRAAEYLLDKPLTWLKLKRFLSGPFAKSSGAWILIVPIAAKSMQKMPDILRIEILGSIYSISTTLPFSWQAFFFGALAFFVARGVYLFRCPLMVQRYDNCSGFIDERRGWPDLLDYLRNTFKYPVRPQPIADLEPGRLLAGRIFEFGENRDLDEFARQRINKALIQMGLGDHSADSSKDIYVVNKPYDQNEISSAFSILFAGANVTRQCSRLFCTVMVICGACLFGIVLVQNVIAVLLLL